MHEDSKELESVLNSLLRSGVGPESKVVDAMRYSTLGGGKRIRPFLVLKCSELFGVKRSYALRVAAAVEMVHCYSLIHDDLPAMDDDELRRGRSTCHIKFDEATAILAGDALLTKAFEVLAAEETHHDAGIRVNLVQSLSKAAGHEGMVGGQMLDIEASHYDFNIQDIKRLQRMKTGELISAACEAGAIIGEASTDARQRINSYAKAIGLAFQIVDDVLDTEGDVDALGKNTGKDAVAGKATFVSVLGVQRAKEKAQPLSQDAQNQLALFGEDALPLRSLAHFIVNRRS